MKRIIGSTGRISYTRTFFGNLIVRIEEEVETYVSMSGSAYNVPDGTYQRKTVWRNATSDDIPILQTRTKQCQNK